MQSNGEFVMSVNVMGYAKASRPVRLASITLSLVGPLCFACGMLVGLIQPRLGSQLETRLFPVIANQSIPAHSVTRTGRWLCWSWVRDKLRSPRALNLDVTLETADGDRSSPEIINSATGLPWHTGGAMPPGHYETPFCLVLPEFTPEGQPVRVRQVITYRGFLGLWDLSVPVPELVAN